MGRLFGGSVYTYVHVATCNVYIFFNKHEATQFDEKYSINDNQRFNIILVITEVILKRPLNSYTDISKIFSYLKPLKVYFYPLYDAIYIVL